MEPVTTLRNAGHTAYLCSFSALDRYFELDAADRYVLTDSSLVDLAKVFDALEFPSHPMEDAAIVSDGVRYLFRCFDEVEPPPINAYAIQELLFDSSRNVFLDPHDVYRDIRRAELGSVHDGYPAWFVATEAARLIARYPLTVDLEEWQVLEAVPAHVDAGVQRDVLFGVLGGGYADRGLELLR